jgi:hypothetical protein
MASSLSNTFRIVYFIAFIFSFIFVLSIIDDELYNLDAVASLINLLDYFIALIEALIIVLVGLVITIANSIYAFFANGISIPFTDLKIFGSTVDYSSVLANGQYVAQSIFPNSSIFRQPLGDPIAELLAVYGVFIAIIVLPFAIFSAIGFLTRGEARLAITSFVAMQVLLIIASYVPNSNNASGRMILIDLTLPTFGGTIETFFSDLLLLLSSQIFLVGLGLYILLELAFQSAYAINVIDPMVDREKRIKRHLNRVDTFSPSRIDKKGAVSLGSGSATVRKYDMLAASYLREMVDKRIFKRGQKTQDEKTTLRLQSYIQSLRRTDRNFEPKITAISAQPNTWNIVKNVIPLIVFRVLFVIILAFVILNPLPILNLVINVESPESGLLKFPALVDSIELTQPEFRTVVLFNVVLIIIAFSAVVHFLLVHKPEFEEKEVKKVSTLVDFQEISDTPPTPIETEEEIEE